MTCLKFLNQICQSSKLKRLLKGNRRKKNRRFTTYGSARKIWKEKKGLLLYYNIRKRIKDMKDNIVYRYTTPDGKVYIGITSRKLKERSGSDGRGYAGCHIFYNAIQKYGWENIEKEILFSHCSRELANKLEIAFIKYYKDRNISLNICKGGQGGSHPQSQTARDKIGSANKIRLLGNKNSLGHKHSDETRRKISEAKKGQRAWNRGLKSNKPAWNKGLKMSETKKD